MPDSPPRSRWQQAWPVWGWRRPSAHTSHTLLQRHLYVLPTKAGGMLGLTLFVLLIASINFQLNLGYALTFLIAGSALSSLWMGYRNVHGLHLQLGALSPVFQGERATVPVLLHAATWLHHRHGVSIAMQNAQGPLAWVHTDIATGQTATIALGSVPHQRGWHQVPRIVVESRFPLGVFRIWSNWQPDGRILVYPAPEVPAPALQFADVDADTAGHTPAHRPGMAEHDGVRSYQRGDPLRSVVWKKAATALATGSGDLVVRDGQRPQAPSLWLDARATGLTDTEAQIARLTAWVLQAHAQQARWGLQLPSGRAIAPAAGMAHLNDCLAALAVDGHAHPGNA